MSIHITKNRIRATGDDASGFLIAMASDETLLEWQKSKFGDENFQRMVNEAIESRHIKPSE